MTLSKYLSQVVVSTGVNDQIRIGEDTGGGVTNYTATLAAGTYFVSGDDAATDLLKEIADAADAAGGSGTWVVALDGTADHKVSIKNSDYTWEILWDDAATTLDGELLGIDDLTASFGAAADTAVVTDYQHKNGWYATQAIEWHDAVTNRKRVSRVESVWGVSVSKDVLASTERLRLRHAYEYHYKSYPDASYTNQSWVDFWLTCNAGERVRFFADATSSMVTFDGVFLPDSLGMAEPGRFSRGINRYSFGVDLGEYVS